MRVVLLGRKGIPADEWAAELDQPDLELIGGTDIQDLRGAFAAGPVDHVIMGAGIDLGDRLEIVRATFELSETTTVHMKDRASGPAGMLPFVRSLLAALDQSA